MKEGNNFARIAGGIAAYAHIAIKNPTDVLRLGAGKALETVLNVLQINACVYYYIPDPSKPFIAPKIKRVPTGDDLPNGAVEIITIPDGTRVTKPYKSSNSNLPSGIYVDVHTCDPALTTASVGYLNNSITVPIRPIKIQ